MDATLKNVLEENVWQSGRHKPRRKIVMSRSLSSMSFWTPETELGVMEKERNMLKNEVFMMKEVQKADVELMKIKQKKWDQDREDLKGEKKLEYLLRSSDVSKEKLKRIKLICVIYSVISFWQLVLLLWTNMCEPDNVILSMLRKFWTSGFFHMKWFLPSMT